MHARIGAAGAGCLHVAPEQQAQRVFEVALHGGLPRLAGEAAEGRSVVRQGEGQRVVTHGSFGNVGRCRVALSRDG